MLSLVITHQGNLTLYQTDTTNYQQANEEIICFQAHSSEIPLDLTIFYTCQNYKTKHSPFMLQVQIINLNRERFIRQNLKMKKFEEVLKQKAHLNKIKNAKKTVPQTSKTNSSKINSSKINDEAQLLLQLYQNKNYDSIPAYKLLRTANLQQYTKGFILRGYGINLTKLAYLTEEDKKKLFEDLKVLPGHTVKLQKIIKAIAKQSYQQVFETQEASEVPSVAKSTKKDATLYSSVSKKKTIQQDIEYARQLQRVLNQYTPTINQSKTKSVKTQKRSLMLSSGQQSKYSKTKYLPPKPLTRTSQISNTNVDFRKKVSQLSTKSSIRKSASGSGANNQKENKIMEKKQQSAKETLSRLLQGVTVGSVVETKKVMEIDLEIGKVKDLYRSFDGAVMSSTIANLDIEELVYAFAGYVANRVVAAPQPEKKNINPLNLPNLKFEPNQEDSLDNQEPIQDQIGQILRESYMHPLYRQSSAVMQNIECDQARSQGSNQEQEPNNSNEFHNGNSNQNHMVQSSFLGGQSFHFGLQSPLKIFQQPEPTDIDYFKPTVDSIFNFIKNIVLSAKMEREISVMATSYLDTFLERSKIQLTSLNYKRLLVTCLLLASKIWDDESFETPSFSKTFPEYSTILLNEMQKQLLKFLEYKLKIDKRQYALVYFKLRKYIKKNIKSYQNRKLNIKLIRQLQSGVRNDYKTNFMSKRNSF